MFIEDKTLNMENFIKSLNNLLTNNGVKADFSCYLVKAKGPVVATVEYSKPDEDGDIFISVTCYEQIRRSE